MSHPCFPTFSSSMNGAAQTEGRIPLLWSRSAPPEEAVSRLSQVLLICELQRQESLKICMKWIADVSSILLHQTQNHSPHSLVRTETLKEQPSPSLSEQYLRLLTVAVLGRNTEGEACLFSSFLSCLNSCSTKSGLSLQAFTFTNPPRTNREFDVHSLITKTCHKILQKHGIWQSSNLTGISKDKWKQIYC